jgi:hypothetical protein
LLLASKIYFIIGLAYGVPFFPFYYS